MEGSVRLKRNNGISYIMLGSFENNLYKIKTSLTPFQGYEDE